MPHTITITIPSPVLLSGEHFKVRYQEYPGGLWVDAGNKTNSPFTISGLSDMQYRIEYKVVKADGTECPARYDVINLVPTECPCIADATGILERVTANQYQIKITFASPITAPSCGYRVEVQGPNGLATSSTYQQLNSPLIIPVATNGAYIVKIWADCCRADTNLCTTLDISAATGTPCVPAEFGFNELQRIVSLINGQYYLRVICTAQSNPPTAVFNFSYLQTNIQAPWPGNPNPGAPDSGSYSGIMSGSPLTILIPVNPNPNVNSMPFTYSVIAVDICGNKIPVT
jgi:hypothetical protein